MGDNAFAHQNVVEHAFIEQNLAGVRLHGGQTSAKIVTVDDLAELGFDALETAGQAFDEVVKTGNAQAGSAFMGIAVVVAYMVKIIAIVKDANSQQMRIIHAKCLLVPMQLIEPAQRSGRTETVFSRKALPVPLFRGNRMNSRRNPDSGYLAKPFDRFLSAASVNQSI